VFLGEFAGARSPVRTFTPLLGVELTVQPDATLTMDVDPRFEHGFLVDTGTVTLAGTGLGRADLGYVGVGTAQLTLVNPTSEAARLLLLGGPPFGEQIVMWWNFVARSHEEIVAFRDDWQNESDRFGRIDGWDGTPRRLPAPPLPNVRIKPRATPPPPS
jgi:redox-sensitive bicupin YhaK (pirin superfamily)